VLHPAALQRAASTCIRTVRAATRAALTQLCDAHAACVPHAHAHAHTQDGVADSKQLSEAQREEVYAALTAHPRIEWAACVIEHTVIDDINILQATMRAMEGAVASLPHGAPDRVLVDGNRVPPALASTGEFIIRGDDKSFAIGAASIIAKVTRDRLMLALDARFPQYGFAQHKGYGTKAHMEAIAKHGPCDVHRRTFAPMKHMV
jgi:ribonuclease HII